MVTVDLVEPTPTKPEQSVALLRDQVFPLYMRYWQLNVSDLYHKDFNPHIQLFMEMWFSGGLRLVLAKDGEAIVGFAVCILFRPMQYQASVFQIHDFFCSNRSDVSAAMFKYLEEMARMLNCDEVWFDSHCQVPPALSDRWSKQLPLTIHRFTRED